MVAIIVLIPLFIPIVIGLLLTGEGYIFYVQKRIGYKNKPFDILKFATMLKNSPNMPGGYITIDNDPRFTPLGKYLRKTKINELPQLINVLKGEMSIVGPRPLLAASLEAYPVEVRDYIYDKRPGITGIGSIIFRDEQHLVTKINDKGQDVWDFYNHTIFPFKGQLELWYQKNFSFYTDSKIILATVVVVFYPNSNIIYRFFGDLPRRGF